MNLRTLAILLMAPILAHSQTSPPSAPTAEELLKQAASAYAHPGNYHIEVMEDFVQTNELQHTWLRTYRTAIHGTGDRFRIEIRSTYATWIEVSDGRTESNYWVEAERYTRHPVTDTTPLPPQLALINYEISKARDTIAVLYQLATGSMHATRLADETISLNGHPLPCYVVHAEFNMKGRTDFSSDRTLWIDKQTHLFRKIVSTNSAPRNTAMSTFPFALTSPGPTPSSISTPSHPTASLSSPRPTE